MATFEFKPRKGYTSLLKHFEKLDKAHAEWGVYQENGIHPEANLTYSELMAIHELREDKWKRPAFKISTDEKFSRQYKRILKKELTDFIFGAASGRYLDVSNVLKPVAEKGRENTYKIFGSPFFLVSNTPPTIRRKGKNIPLVETGELREKIRAKVIKRRS